MGHSTKYFHPRNMNKIAIVVCLASFVSAEADADALYGVYGYGYSGLAGSPYAGYAGYGVSNGANSVGIAGAAPAAVPAAPGLYAGAGRYVANSAGVVHVAKRSADADAYYGGYYGYGGLRSYGLGYRGYGYGGYRGYYYG